MRVNEKLFNEVKTAIKHKRKGTQGQSIANRFKISMSTYQRIKRFVDYDEMREFLRSANKLVDEEKPFEQLNFDIPSASAIPAPIEEAEFDNQVLSILREIRDGIQQLNVFAEISAHQEDFKARTNHFSRLFTRMRV